MSVSILMGSLLVFTFVVVVPAAAIVGAVYVQYLMERRPPGGGHRVRSRERAGAARSDVLAVEA